MKEAARQASETLQLEAIAAKGLTGSDAKVEATVPSEPPLKARQRHSNTRRQGRLARYEEVMRRHQAGESIRAIGRAMGLDHRTVAGLVHAQAFPERAPRAAAPSLLDAHRQYLAPRAAEGCRDAMQVWHELRSRGFTGGRSIVRDAFAQLRGDTPKGGRLHSIAVAVRKVVRPSTRRACAWVFGWDKPELAQAKRDDRRRFVQTLCRIKPAVAAARSLAHQFIGLVRHRDLDSFDRWMLQARACSVPEMQRFAAGL